VGWFLTIGWASSKREPGPMMMQSARFLKPEASEKMEIAVSGYGVT